MNAVDTQILLYALNQDCAEHESCKTVVELMHNEPERWLLADQVLLELYRLLRNPSVLERPLDASRAAATVAHFDQIPLVRVGYEHSLWPKLALDLAQKSFPARRVFDAQLAHTLRANGATVLYTRNVKDFASAGFAKLIDPVGKR